jgi:aminoglycoside phosphotransferase (APT) family kinase protein
VNFFERTLHVRIGRQRLAELGLNGAMETVLVTPRFNTSRHVIALLSPAGSGNPALAAKVPRRPGDSSGVRTEEAILRRLASAESAVQGVPRIIGLFEEDGHSVLVETALDGSPLDPRRVKEHFDDAVRAGVEFVQRLPPSDSNLTSSGWLTSAIEAPLRRLAAASTGTVSTDLVEDTLAMLHPLAESGFRPVYQHGDLSHPNLLWGPDGLRVMDWERANTTGLPGADLVFYLQYLAESLQDAYNRAAQVSVFDETFGSSEAWGSVIVADYLSDLGILPTLASEVILATFAGSAGTLTDRLGLSQDLREEERGALAPGPWDVGATIADDRDVVLWQHIVRQLSR